MADYINESKTIYVGTSSWVADWQPGEVWVGLDSRGLQFAINIMHPDLKSITVSYAGWSKTFEAVTGEAFYPYVIVERGTIFTPFVQNKYKVTFTGTTTSGGALYFGEDTLNGKTFFSIGEDNPNRLPTASISVPTLFAGKTAKITWSTSDADGDTVYTRSLVRYIKMPGQSNFAAQKTLISSDTTATSFTDTIPSDAGGAQVYYYLTFTDKVGAAQAKQSSTVTVYTNTAPTAPGTILVAGDITGSTATGGGNVVVSWTASSDVDGNLVGYELEKQEDGGSWTQIYKGSVREFGTTITEGLSTIRYRVRAYDAMGAVSGYTTGTVYTVNNNKAPAITISNIVTDGSIGTFTQDTGAPEVTYTVEDPENTRMTVEEYLDGALLRSKGTFGGSATISFTDDAWIRILNGEHVLRIVATDADGSVGTAEVRFTKDVDRIELILLPDVNRETDTRPTMIMVNVQGLIPDGAILQAWATNNANDASPVWEEITSAVQSRGKHIFTNETKTAEKWAVNVRIVLERGDAESVCAITSVGGNWK